MVPGSSRKTGRKMRLFVETQLFVKKGANILKWKVWISGKTDFCDLERRVPRRRDVQLVGLGATETLAEASGPTGAIGRIHVGLPGERDGGQSEGGMSTEAKGVVLAEALKDANQRPG